MGSPAAVGESDEHPQHPVRLSPFRIQAHEVTNAEYRRFDPAHDSLAGENLSVVHVTWNEAMAYAAWLGGSLPTEAQWEFAARGENGREYPWGDAPPTRGRANYDSTATAPVGSFPAGATPEGVQDLAGNVWEWCRDWWDRYPQEEFADPPGPGSGLYRVVRGGSFAEHASNLRSAARGSLPPGYGRDLLGFRVVWVSAGGQE
jgi:formylglycine-generating enzyme required for sulfatase activity